MVEDEIYWRVGSISSLPFQEKYVIGGTKDCYIREDELINDVYELEKMIRIRPVRDWIYENQIEVSTEQRLALRKLLERLDQIVSDQTNRGETSRETWANWIRNDPAWISLRRSALYVLKCFDIDPELSVHEIDAL